MAVNNSNENKKAASEGRYASKRKKWLSVTAFIIAIIFIVWTVAASLVSVWADELRSALAGGVVTETAAGTSQELRGVWVSTAYSLDYPSAKTTDAESLKAQADKILDNIKNMNMNAVFLQVRPSGDAFYKSEIFPWSKYLTGTQGTAPADDFDPLAYWVSAAHERGLELHAWINPFMITRSGESDWIGLSADNPAKSDYADCVVKYSDGNYYYDPGNPRTRELVVKGALEIVNNYDVDGIHLDDYFYPGTSFNDDATWNAYGSGFTDRADWRRDNINQLIAALDTQLHQADSSIRFGVSPQGVWANSSTMSGGSATRGNESYSQRFADSLAWIKAGTVDYIAPQIYWSIGYSAADYSVLVKWWSDAVSGSDVDLYIGMADYRSSNVTDTSSVWYGTSELKRQLDLNRTYSAVKGEIHFRYSLMAKDSGIMELYRTYYADSDSKDHSSVKSDVRILVNGREVTYTDAAPFIDSNKRTLCPLRVVADALGMTVEWDNDGRRAIFTDGDTQIIFTIGSDEYQVDDMIITMDTAAVLKNSRTYAPVRYLAEAAGWTVDWDSETRTVIIEK